MKVYLMRIIINHEGVYAITFFKLQDDILSSEEESI